MDYDSQLMSGILLETEVNRALRGERTHPVVTLIDTLPSIAEFSLAYSPIKGVQQQNAYAKQHFGFFADAVERLGSFPLDPFDLITIWKKVAEMNLPRYETAAILGCSYGKPEFESPEWQMLPRRILEGGRYPQELAVRLEEIRAYIGRLNQINGSLEEIDFYRFGVKMKFMEIARGFMSNDELKKQEAQHADARSKRPEMAPLGVLMEQVGTGMTILYTSLDLFCTENHIKL